MSQEIEQRSAELKNELETGQQQMAALEQRRHELRDTLLRITGAIQVLEELKEGGEGGSDGNSTVAAPAVEIAAADRAGPEAASGNGPAEGGA